MKPRYKPGDILMHDGNGYNPFHALVMDIEYKTNPDEKERVWPFDVYVLLVMDENETYKVSVANIDCSTSYKKVA